MYFRKKKMHNPKTSLLMKKMALILILIASANHLFAQQRALTEKGKEVILYDNGTWKYINDKFNDNEIPTNSKPFVKSEEASFLLKSSNLNVGFWLNPKKWIFKKAVMNQDAEYEFQWKEGDLYGMAITEKVEIPLETLKTIALDNAKTFSPDIRIVKEEYRKVNGIKVLLLQLSGTAQGIQFSYYGYYYSNSNGTVQFITYTSQNLMDDYKNDCEEMLNGMVEL
jgi:hypothetical protein